MERFVHVSNVEKHINGIDSSISDYEIALEVLMKFPSETWYDIWAADIQEWIENKITTNQ